MKEAAIVQKFNISFLLHEKSPEFLDLSGLVLLRKPSHVALEKTLHNKVTPEMNPYPVASKKQSTANL